MKRLLWIAGLGALGAAVLLVASRGQAAATDMGSCTPTEAFVPAFCLNVPPAGVRRETTVLLTSLPSQRADVGAETTVAGSDAAALTAAVDRSVARVEAVFGRSFSARPRVLLFATSASFAQGAAELFGYSTETAEHVASTYGGILDRPTATIAVNWSAAGRERMSAAIEHELTHLMVREITGGNEVPAWLEEGIATVLEQDAAGTSIAVADERLAGLGVAASGNRFFTVFAAAAEAEVVVSVSGGRAYSVTFTVRTDEPGMYRGSFGSTAAPGIYTVQAAGATATLVTTR